MSFFKFNRIYIIESLPVNEKQTGTELYKDLIRWKVQKYPELKSDIFHPDDKKDWVRMIDKIRNECAVGSVVPVLHFEMHGNSNLNGLVLKSGESVDWEELYHELVEINILTKNNLFITMAVCHGAYFKIAMHIDRPVPFYGLIGSFEEIYLCDFPIRYNDFYEEFLSSLNLNVAYKKLIEANPSMSTEYRFISAEETFQRVYKDYINNNCTEEALKERALQNMPLSKYPSRREKRGAIREFKKKYEVTKNKFYREHCQTFFMLDKYPENRERFNIPDTLQEFLQMNFT